MVSKFSLIRNITAALVLMLTTCLSIPLQASAAGTLSLPWYQNDSKTGASGNVISHNTNKENFIPTDKTYCYAYHMGVKYLNSPITWDMGSFTGMGIPQPFSNFQRGSDPNWVGSTACEMNGRHMGFQVHKDSIIANNPTAGGPRCSSESKCLYGMQMVKNYDTDFSIRPWLNYPQGDASLRIQAFYNVHNRYTPPGVIQYGQFVVSLYDTSQPPSGPGESNSIWWSIRLWDSRGNPYVGVSNDSRIHKDDAAGGDTDSYVVDSYIGDPVYSTKHFNSQNLLFTKPAGSVPNDRFWYGVYISRTDLISAVTALNQKPGINKQFSTNPADYAVNLIGVGTEMSSPNGKLGWVGSRAWDLQIYTEHSGTNTP